MTRLTEFPRISIVTPSYNQGKYLEQTILSVLEQGYPNLEYFIIDGGSNDESVEIIKKYEKHVKYWVSEKDNGQANAINKGLKLSTGEIFTWLNSDDYLEPGALFKIAEAFTNSNCDVVAGRVNNFSISESEIVQNQNLTAEGLMCWLPGVHFVQPGVWLRRKQFIECGGVDEQFHYAFDWDLLIRYLCLYPRVEYLTNILVHFRLHGESKTVSSNEKFLIEERRIIEKLFSDPRFTKIHFACKQKITRTNWTSLLHSTANHETRSRFWKINKIISNLVKQPLDSQVWRTALGTLRRIMLYNRLNT